MPVILNEIQYTDEWGNSLGFYRGNAGDKQTARLKCTSTIQLNTVDNPISFDPTTQAFISSSKSFEDEGFRVGQTILVKAYDNTYTVIGTPYTSTITYVDGNEIRLSTVLGFYNQSLGEILEITCTSASRESIDGLFNLVLNSTTGGDFSLIDGEATRFYFSGIDSLTIDAVTNGVFVGNQSGAIVESVKITRKTTAVAYAQYFFIDIVFVNTGFYNSNWFTSSECLKPYFKTLWSTVEGEPFSQFSLVVKDSANSGYFNQYHNTSPNNSILVSGVPELDYSVASTFDIVVNGVTTDLGIGSCFVSIDDTYYKNKALNQSVYSMLLYTSDLSVTTYSSEQNELGAGYDIEVNSITTLGAQTTINVTFTPNSDFNDFIDENDSTDRRFYLWVKCGNANLTAFAGTLTKAIPVGGTLTLNRINEFYDHSQNINVASNEITDLEFDTEDDIAFYCDMRLEKNQTYSNIKCRIIAENTVTSNAFTLQETIFDLSTAVVSAGIVLTNQMLTINPTLPTTSVKRDAYFRNKASLNNTLNFGVELYYPFILRFEDWLQQLNADASFYPNQNKDWTNYSDFGDWVLKFEIELIKNDLAYIYQQSLTDYIYDNSDVINSDVILRKASDNSIVTSVFDELLIAESEHELTIGTWNPSKTWGMIAVREKNTSNRFISSTAIDFDNNSSNPLYPITGLRCSLTFPTATTALMRCYFDPSKLNVQDYDFTPKIKDISYIPVGEKTTSPDDVQKTTSPDDTIKTLAE
jgi:hypothetical protein